MSLLSIFKHIGFSRHDGRYVATVKGEFGPAIEVELYQLLGQPGVRLKALLHPGMGATALLHVCGFIAAQTEPAPGILWRLEADRAAVAVLTQVAPEECLDSAAAVRIVNHFATVLFGLHSDLAATIDCASQWERFAVGTVVRARQTSPYRTTREGWIGLITSRGPIPGWIQVSNLDETRNYLVHSTFFEVLPEENLTEEIREQLRRIARPDRPAWLRAGELRPGDWVRTEGLTGQVYRVDPHCASIVTEKGFFDLTEDKLLRIHPADFSEEIRRSLWPRRGTWARSLADGASNRVVLVESLEDDQAAILEAPENKRRKVPVSSLVRVPSRLAPLKLRLVVGHFLTVGERQPLLPGTSAGSWVLGGLDEPQILRLVEARQTDFVALTATGIQHFSYRGAQVISAAEVPECTRVWGEPAQGQWARVVGVHVFSLHEGTLADGLYGRVEGIEEGKAVLELPGRIVKGIPMTMLLPVSADDVPWAWTLRRPATDVGRESQDEGVIG